MASHTLTNFSLFPVGTSVSAYVKNAMPGGVDRPLGTPVNTQTMGTSGLTFSGLVVDTEYVAFGQVSGEWRQISFTAQVAPGLPVFTDDEAQVDLEVLRNVFNVKLNGATGDGVTTDTTAVLATVQAAIDAGGGVVHFPRGTYKMTAAITIPAGSPVHLRGDGVAATTLQWTTDLPTQTRAIVFEEQSATTIQRTISDLRLQGPSGATTATRDCLYWSTRTRVVNCLIDGWRHGLYVWGNHSTALMTRVRNCKYGVYFADGSPTLGDQNFTACGITDCSFASVAIAGEYAIFCTFIDTHIGFSPYGFYGETSAGGVGLMNGVYMYGVTCESWGDAFIRSNNRAIRGSSFQNVSTRRVMANQLGGQADNAVIDLGTGVLANVVMSYFEVELGSGATLPPTGFIICAEATDNQFDGMSKTMDSVVASNWPFIVASGKSRNNGVRWGNSEGRVVQSDVILTQGHALGASGHTGSAETQKVRKYTAGDWPVGFATHACASGAKVLAQTRGQIGDVPASGAIAAGDLVTDSGTAGAVSTAANLSDLPVFGVARSAAASSLVALEVRL